MELIEIDPKSGKPATRKGVFYTARTVSVSRQDAEGEWVLLFGDPSAPRPGGVIEVNPRPRPAVVVPVRGRPKRAVGLNDPCPCGRGRKFKRCCRTLEYVE